MSFGPVIRAEVDAEYRRSTRLLKEHARALLTRLTASVIEDVVAIEPASARALAVNRVAEVLADLRHEVVASPPVWAAQCSSPSKFSS